MLRPWLKILPFFVVIWLARRNLDRFRLELMDGEFVNPYTGVLVKVKI